MQKLPTKVVLIKPDIALLWQIFHYNQFLANFIRRRKLSEASSTAQHIAGLLSQFSQVSSVPTVQVIPDCVRWLGLIENTISRALHHGQQASKYCDSLAHESFIMVEWMVSEYFEIVELFHDDLEFQETSIP